MVRPYLLIGSPQNTLLNLQQQAASTHQVFGSSWDIVNNLHSIVYY